MEGGGESRSLQAPSRRTQGKCQFCLYTTRTHKHTACKTKWLPHCRGLLASQKKEVHCDVQLDYTYLRTKMLAGASLSDCSFNRQTAGNLMQGQKSRNSIGHSWVKSCCRHHGWTKLTKSNSAPHSFQWSSLSSIMGPQTCVTGSILTLPIMPLELTLSIWPIRTLLENIACRRVRVQPIRTSWHTMSRWESTLFCAFFKGLKDHGTKKICNRKIWYQSRLHTSMSWTGKWIYEKRCGVQSKGPFTPGTRRRDANMLVRDCLRSSSFKQFIDLVTELPVAIFHLPLDLIII